MFCILSDAPNNIKFIIYTLFTKVLNIYIFSLKKTFERILSIDNFINPQLCKKKFTLVINTLYDLITVTSVSFFSTKNILDAILGLDGFLRVQFETMV